MAFPQLKPAPKPARKQKTEKRKKKREKRNGLSRPRTFLWCIPHGSHPDE
jgi:hypothetical protein